MTRSPARLLVIALIVMTDPDLAAQAPQPEADPLPPGAVARIGTTRYRHSSWHKRVFFTADNKTLIHTDDGRTVYYWDVATGRKFDQVEIPGARFENATYDANKNLLAIIGMYTPNEANRTEYHLAAWLFDTAKRKVVQTFRMPDLKNSVYHNIRQTADGSKLFTIAEGNVRVWDTKTGGEIGRARIPMQAGALAVTPDMNTVIYGRYDLHSWNWRDGEDPKLFLKINGFGAEAVELAPDGKSLYVDAHGGGLLTIWDVTTGKQTGSFGVQSSPYVFTFSPDGKTLAVAYHSTSSGSDLERNVVLWDVASGKEKARFPLGGVTADFVSWSADGSRIAAGTSYRLWAWDVKTGQSLCPDAVGHEGHLTAITFGPDGRLYTGGDDHTLRSWDATTGKQGLTLSQTYWVRGVAVSPDGKLLAGSGLRNDLRVFDAKTGTEKYRLLGNGEMGGKRKVRFTPDNSKLVAWGDDFYLRVWNMANGKLLAENRIPPIGMTFDDMDKDRLLMMTIGMEGSDISPDGSLLVQSTMIIKQQREVQFLDTTTGNERFKLEVDENGVQQLAFSPDGKKLLVAGRNPRREERMPNGRTQSSIDNVQPLSLWDLESKEAVWSMAVEGKSARNVGFTPDGKRVGMTYSPQDKQYRLGLWDAATGAATGGIPFVGTPGTFAFDPTGKKVAVGFMDTTALVYTLPAAAAK